MEDSLTAEKQWSEGAKERTLRAFRQAGFDKENLDFARLRQTILMSEPEAAALAVVRDFDGEKVFRVSSVYFLILVVADSCSGRRLFRSLRLWWWHGGKNKRISFADNQTTVLICKGSDLIPNQGSKTSGITGSGICNWYSSHESKSARF